MTTLVRLLSLSLPLFLSQQTRISRVDLITYKTYKIMSIYVCVCVWIRVRMYLRLYECTIKIKINFF